MSILIWRTDKYVKKRVLIVLKYVRHSGGLEGTLTEITSRLLSKRHVNVRLFELMAKIFFFRKDKKKPPSRSHTMIEII